MKDFLKRLQQFFFPPPGSPRWMRVLPYAVLGVLTLLVLTASAYGWEYTNSPEFCGTTCHTMPPEYTAYLTSPHARIACVECHIGRDFIATRITRKAGDLRHVFATAFQTYEFPIRARNLRPARETCEKCHFPEKFSDDSLRTIKSYENDYSSTPLTTYLVLKTGGGSKRIGLGRGIHWHIENQVYYLPTDPEEQHIPYVRVVEDDGSISEYTDVSAGIDPKTINAADLKEMDCITCHNRITHLVLTPGDTVDQLISRGIISAAIPEIRKKAVEVYSRSYDSVDMGLKGISGLAAYYQVYYPDFYAANGDEVDSAVAALQQAYQNSVFPEQNSDWNTHPNNIGHKNSPGCFRCHDGKHLNAQGQAIRLECNLCHSIPVVAGPDDFVADVEISRGPEPDSHFNPNWISMHHLAFDTSCETCHDTTGAGGTTNTSFCSNSACHGNVWEYAGFDAPALREVLVEQLPPTPTPGPAISEGAALTYDGSVGALFQSRCGACHNASAKTAGLNLTSYQDALSGGQDGPVIVPGDPDGSLLVQKQTSDKPHFAQLNMEELDLVVKWIEAGAPEK
jgi:nitrate/TMAO reductase-like tetraheme cytochrome c subunit/mono/diheme cytochrome c family protein